MDLSDNEYEDEEAAVHSSDEEVTEGRHRSTRPRTRRNCSDPLSRSATDGGAESGSAPTDLQIESLSLIRTIFPPYMHISSPASDSAAHAAAYMPWPSSSLLATAPEPLWADELLPETFDSEAEEAELLAEDQLDRADQAAAKQAQKSLWDKVFSASGPDCAWTRPGAEAGPDGERDAEHGDKARPPRKRRSEEVADEDDSSREIVEADRSTGKRSFGAGSGANGKTKTVVPLRRGGRPRKKLKSVKHYTQEKLMYAAPAGDSKIKSAVYVESSDDE